MKLGVKKKLKSKNKIDCLLLKKRKKKKKKKSNVGLS